MKAIEIQRLNNKLVLVAAVKFSELNPIVRFTKRESINWKPYEFNDNSIEANQDYFQRLTDSLRVTQIAKFIEEVLWEQQNNLTTISTLFPSSIIIGVDIENHDSSSDIFEINLPNERNSCLIVDGQHRFAAMRKLLNTYESSSEPNKDNFIKSILNYKFNCTILVNFDLWEQAQLFANVNFNQKKVSKSLYYDIFGSTPESERIDRYSGIYLAHSLAKFLNNSEKSPLKGFINMLGSGGGYFSQAFLVEAILAHLRSKGVWADIDEDYKLKGNKHKVLSKVFIAYFNAIKQVFNNHWPNKLDSKYESILCKTTGMGSLVRMLGYIYQQLQIGAFPNENKVSFETVETIDLENIFKRIFSTIKDKEDDLFGKQSIYSGAGSFGLQSKLYKRIGQELGLFKDVF
ncbi:MAG: DGQHR domain-containing protein [Lentimicrobium sp.]